MALNTNLNNKEMINIAKKEMIQMIARQHGDRCEAAKALAFLIMAENNKQIMPTITPKYNSTTNGLCRYECPMCGKEITGCNYCPNCGAKFI